MIMYEPQGCATTLTTLTLRNGEASRMAEEHLTIKSADLVRNRGNVLLQCPICMRHFTLSAGEVAKAKLAITCGRACRAKSMLMEGNANWKGGRITHLASGYIYVRTVGCKYRLEHRVVMERKLNRPLLRKEIVHHDNEVRTDNSEDNLILADNASEHTARFHGVHSDPATGRFVKPVSLRGVF